MKEWEEEELNLSIQWKQSFCLFLYTPMCGTCQVATKMLSVTLEAQPGIRCGKMNLNYMKHIASQYEIESVPCLLIFKNGQLEKKIYAFQSVPYLFDELKGIS
ncbi:thiol reductase thioredoxin [Bacillus sp. M6-12]|uniref:thioredoxin family protein n=1 Tax=Bacillus sp. M6-12 TaxID=2054166 RepID=UPI000C756F32|nr:thioredoxin family protein [Bacillus sp. M6-12]PLS18064.1 thiol reductase thioredoxin [Bacillus sp. M6-12]